jgi:hypothetical protein
MNKDYFQLNFTGSSKDDYIHILSLLDKVINSVFENEIQLDEEDELLKSVISRKINDNDNKKIILYIIQYLKYMSE